MQDSSSTVFRERQMAVPVTDARPAETRASRFGNLRFADNVQPTLPGYR